MRAILWYVLITNSMARLLSLTFVIELSDRRVTFSPRRERAAAGSAVVYWVTSELRPHLRSHPGSCFLSSASWYIGENSPLTYWVVLAMKSATFHITGPVRWTNNNKQLTTRAPYSWLYKMLGFAILSRSLHPKSDFLCRTSVMGSSWRNYDQSFDRNESKSKMMPILSVTPRSHLSSSQGHLA